MGRMHYDESLQNDGDFFSMDDNVYREPKSVPISEDWDTLMEDFLDDFEDYNDIDFPTPDDDF